MKAVVFDAAERALRLDRVPDPLPGPDEAIVRVTASGVCSGDLAQVEGRDAAGRPRLPDGAVLGHEFAGEVVAVGTGVRRLAVGDSVAAHAIVGCGSCVACVSGDLWGCPARQVRGGGFAEYAVVREDTCHRVAPDLDPVSAALVEPLASAIHGCRMVPPTAQRILVRGLGPLGASAVRWLRASTGADIAVSARSDRRAPVARELGAVGFVQVGPNEAQQVSELLGDAPDVVLDCVGKPGSAGAALKCVGFRGLVVILGVCSGPDQISHWNGILKEATLRYSTAYTAQEFGFVAGELRTPHPFDALVETTTPLETFPAAFAALRAGEARGKLMLRPHGADGDQLRGTVEE